MVRLIIRTYNSAIIISQSGFFKYLLNLSYAINKEVSFLTLNPVQYKVTVVFIMPYNLGSRTALAFTWIGVDCNLIHRLPVSHVLCLFSNDFGLEQFWDRGCGQEAMGFEAFEVLYDLIYHHCPKPVLF